MSNPNSPCAACKFLRRKCTPECVFSPYFPPDQPEKFATVHKAYGASNVAKILNELPAGQREDAVHSLYFEADARLKDPIYGCVGFIAILQNRLKQLQTDLLLAQQELAQITGPAQHFPAPAPELAFHTVQGQRMAAVEQAMMANQDPMVDYQIQPNQHQFFPADNQEQQIQTDIFLNSQQNQPPLQISQPPPSGGVEPFQD